MAISTIPMFFAPEGGIEKDSGESPLLGKGGLPLSRKFTIFLLAMLLINFGRNSVALIKPQYLSLDTGFNLSSSMLSYVLNTSSAAMFAVGLFVRKLSKFLEDEALLVIGTVISIVYLSAFAFAQNLTLIFIGNFLAGTSNAVIFASSYSYA